VTFAASSDQRLVTDVENSSTKIELEPMGLTKTSHAPPKFGEQGRINDSRRMYRAGERQQQSRRPDGGALFRARGTT
jgi:hypothetical protein